MHCVAIVDTCHLRKTAICLIKIMYVHDMKLIILHKSLAGPIGHNENLAIMYPAPPTPRPAYAVSLQETRH